MAGLGDLRKGCARCERTIPSCNTRYCSMECVLTVRKERSRVQRACAECGSAIWTYQSQIGKIKNERKYCSKVCMDRHRSVMEICKGCNEPFKRMRSVERKYCSRKCSGLLATDLFRPCLKCGSSFRYRPHNDESAKFCSFKCKVVYEGAGRRAAPTDKNRCARQQWREIRSQIIARDGFLCQLCGCPEDLTVHHIRKWRLCKDDSPENLVTLCRSCHIKTEFPGRSFGSGRALSLR